MSDVAAQSGELVSVIVTTFNRAETLARSLRCLVEQETGSAFELEVIVVDNGSTDGTRSCVEMIAAASGVSVRYVLEPRQGLPFARNRGLREARGQWIAFFDDDQLADAQWLGRLFAAARRRGVDCIGGARTLQFESEPAGEVAPYCRQLLGESTAGTAPRRYDRRLLPTTGNVLIRRELIDRLGSFNETWLEGGEDTEFFNRLVSSRCEAWYEPTAVVEHLISASRLTPQYLERTARRHGVTIGRRDLEERGRVLLPVLMAARTVQAALVFAPRLAAARLLGGHADALAWRCRLRRVEGYVRFGLQACGLSQQRRFLDGMVHRDASSSTPSAPLRRPKPLPQSPRREAVEGAS